MALPNPKRLLRTAALKPPSILSAPSDESELSMHTLNYLPSTKEKQRALDEFVEMNMQPLSFWGVYWSQHHQQWCMIDGTLIVEETVRQGFSIPSHVYHVWWYTQTSDDWRM